MLSNEYAAGFFDGEGCINITVTGKNRQVRLRVMLVNTDQDILLLFQAKYGGNLTMPKVLKDGWKPYCQLYWFGNSAIEFLSHIRPYILLKRSQIELAFEFWDFMHTPRRDRCEQVPTPREGSPNQVSLKRTPETISKEMDFKSRMHALNRKGAA
jgi:hypothetical protein